MLKNCKSDETPSGMFNEYLVDELYSHRRVMEALSNEMRVAPSDDQLSGLGFALDKRADIVVKVSGTETRVLRVKF
jgi:cyanophycinase-like exopeptidase